MPPSLLLLRCLLLSVPAMAQGQVRSPPGVNPHQYNHGQGHQDSRQQHGQGHHGAQQQQGQQKYQGQPAGNGQNNQGQVPSQNMHEGQQILQQNSQGGQIPTRSSQEGSPSMEGGQIHSQNSQGHVPSQNSQGQVPVQKLQGQVPSQNIPVEMPNQHSTKTLEPVLSAQSGQMAAQQQLKAPGQDIQQPDKQKLHGSGQLDQDQSKQHQGHGQHQQGGHGHGQQQQSDHGQQRVLHKDIGHEKEHMKEHLDVPMDTSKMSDQELQFHYFKMHDTDGNNKLDGCELVKSLIHWHADDSGHQHGVDSHSSKPPKIFLDQELATMIDPILVSDDRNKDGFIDYYEFVAAQNAQVEASS